MSDNNVFARLGLESEEAAWMDSNLPVQAWREEDGGTRFVCYMPRKEACFTDEEPRQDPSKTARDAARLLRNLAALFDAYAEGKIDHVYYPDRDVGEAIAECEAKRKRTESSEHV